MKKIIITLLFGLLAFAGFSQDPYQTKQKISNPLTQAEANGALSSQGPMWSLMTDTIHAYAISKYRGALVMRHADSLIYSNTGSYWRCVEQEFAVGYPVYIDYSDPLYPRGILKVALPDGGNKLLRTGGIILVDNELTVAPDIIWTFNSQVKIETLPQNFTIADATPDYKRIDIIFIDSLDNMIKREGQEDTGTIFAPEIDYNGIVVTTLTIFGDSAISLDPIDNPPSWTKGGDTVNIASAVIGSKNAVDVRHIYNNSNLMTLKSTGLVINRNEFSPTNDKNSYSLSFYGGNTNEQVGTLSMDGFIAGPTWGAFKMISTGDIGILGNSAGQMATNFRTFTYQNALGINHVTGNTGIFNIGNSAQGATHTLLQGTRQNIYNTQVPIFQFGLRGTFLMQKDSISAVIAPSAMMDLRHDSKGILIPRMTTTDRDAISSPATSLLIFNNTTNQYEWYDGSDWVALGGGGAAWSPTGNSGLDAGVNFIGNTDAVPVIIKSDNVAVATFGAISGGAAFNVNIGRDNTVGGGVDNIAIGQGSTATGNNSIAIGRIVTSTGQSSLALGQENSASGSYSTVIGRYNTSRSMHGFVIGHENNDDDNPDPFTADPSDRLFQIGIGSYKNAMTVLRNGRIGIGADNYVPAAALHIKAIATDLTPLIIDDLGTYADDTAAGVAGLTTGMLYKTSAGALMIKL